LDDGDERHVGGRTVDRIGRVGGIDPQKVDDGRPSAIKFVSLQVDEGQQPIRFDGLLRGSLFLIQTGRDEPQGFLEVSVEVVLLGGRENALTDGTVLGVNGKGGPSPHNEKYAE
jgi:hypothetical protein